MGDITSVTAMNSALQNVRSQGGLSTFLKASLTSVTGTYCSGWLMTGVPTAGAAPSTPAYCYQTTTGALATFVNPPQGGITWTSRTSASDNQWRGIAWSPSLGLFCAVAITGTGNRVMTSPDGITWTSRTSAADNSWRAIAWSPSLNLFCAVSSTGSGNRVMTSPDGITWTSRTSAADNDWYAIAWSPTLSLFCAVATSGTGDRVMTSPDGITWTSRTSAADNSWHAIAWSPSLGLFCAVSGSGTGNRVMTSPDGITWTSRTSAADNNWWSIAWSPALSLFCAVSSTGTGNRVMTSPDGITWTSRTSAADNQWYGVEWAPEIGLFCAVSLTGTGNRVMTSPDGITWTSRTSAVDNQWVAIAWAPSLRQFCAVDFSGTTNGVMTSEAGTNRLLQCSMSSGSSNAPSTWFFYDRLSHMGGLVVNSTNLQTVNLDIVTPASNGRCLSTGVDVDWFLEFYTAGSFPQSATATITYTNQAGTGGQTTTISLATTTIASNLFRVVPSGTDTGIKSIQSVQLNQIMSSTAYNFGFTAGKLLCQQGYCLNQITAQAVALEPMTSMPMLCMPKVGTDACIWWVCIANGTGSVIDGYLIIGGVH